MAEGTRPGRLDAKALARFEAKYVVAENGCWQWTACIDGGGYSRFGLDKRTRRAHIVSFEHYVGPVAVGLQLDHICRNRACVNPQHLEPVTQGENLRRGIGPTAVNARKTHCKRGHEFTPENIYWKRGGRICRECERLRWHRRYRARRAGFPTEAHDD